MKLYLDDMRFPSEPGWSIVRNVDDFLYMWTKNMNEVTDISLDHDLGTEETGCDALKMIGIDLTRCQTRVYVHSKDPVNAKKMRERVRQIYEKRGQK